jgi:hypothetical protein
VSSKATPIMPLARPEYTPNTRSRSSSCTSAELEYVVDENGLIEPGSAHVLRSTDPQFADAVINVLPAWHYQPAMKDGKPVRQITRYKATVQTVTVAVPAGSGPPRSLPPGTRVPNC